MTLLKAATNIDPDPIKSDTMPMIVDNSSILAEVDPLGNASTTPIFDSNQIVTYVVRSGDTLPAIAKVFGVTTNTIMIANRWSWQNCLFETRCYNSWYWNAENGWFNVFRETDETLPSASCGCELVG